MRVSPHGNPIAERYRPRRVQGNTIKVDGNTILIINIDSNELYNDNGFVGKAVLDVVSEEINRVEYDLALLLAHYSILRTDDCPLNNSSTLIDFIQKYKIEYVFCGQIHELELMRTNDLYFGHTFLSLYVRHALLMQSSQRRQYVPLL